MAAKSRRKSPTPTKPVSYMIVARNDLSGGKGSLVCLSESIRTNIRRLGLSYKYDAEVVTFPSSDNILEDLLQQAEADRKAKT